jgi:UDP-N-acetylmuramoylalanine--D-glutamate ligase
MEDWRDKRVLILGAGISGQGAYKALLEVGAMTCIYDDNPIYKSIDNCNTHSNKDIVCDNQVNSIGNFDMVVTSPGIPMSHRTIALAQQLGIYTIGELELGYQLHTAKHGHNISIIAVTGTNGKTTLCKMITHMLSLAGYKACLAGNIGMSFAQASVLLDYDIVVLEVSSFQLSNIDKFAPHIAILTNITQDHLDVHANMQQYIDCKLNISRNQTQSNYTILCDVHDSYIYDYQPSSTLINLHLHDNYNNNRILEEVSTLLGISSNVVQLAIDTFKPDRHRLEDVATINNTTYINDSKATNVAATLYALTQVKGTVALILGGSHKKLDYQELFDNLPNTVKYIFGYGDIKQLLSDIATTRGIYIQTCDNLRQATQLASNTSVDTVLLSPATASFDNYTNYQARGDAFCSYVRELLNKDRQITI